MRRISLVLFAILLGAMQPLPAFASHPVHNYTAYPTQQASGIIDNFAACGDDSVPASEDKNAGFEGKPVNLLSGEESFARTDVTIGILFPINVTRRYGSASNYDSPIGYGWALNYDRRIYTYPDGSITLRKECGWKKRFMLVSGAYVTPLGETGTLVKNVDESYTYTYKGGFKDNYDSRGRLVSRVDTNENSLVIYYELDSRSPLWGLLPTNLNQSSSHIVAYDYRVSRIEEKDALGTLTDRFVLFHYDSSSGRLTDVVDNTGRTVTYDHDNIGNLTAVAGPAVSAAYGYSEPNYKHRMTSIDEGQGVYVNTYDSTGKVTRQTHGTGVIDFQYITPRQKTKTTTTIADSSGTVLNTRSRTVEFDSNGLVNKVTDNLGNVKSYTRDSNMWITRDEYWENTGTISSPTFTLRTANDYSYDGKGNMLSRTEAQGTTAEKTISWTYDPDFSNVLTSTRESLVSPGLFLTDENTYNSNGNLLIATENGLLGDGTPYSYTKTYSYNNLGQVTSIDGARTDVQDVVAYSYNPSTNYRTAVTLPNIGTTTYSNFDLLGNPQTVTDPNGNITTYTYDAVGRITSVKAPGNANATHFFYVPSGSGMNNIDHITLPEGNTISYTYDSMGNLATVKDNLNNTIKYVYDSERNLLTKQIKDSTGTLQKSLSYEYDALSRLSKIVNPDNSFTQYTYDAFGNAISIQNPKNAVTNYTYNAIGQLMSSIQPGNVTTSYEYNYRRKLKKVIDANNNATVYKYDDADRVYQMVSPDTGTTTNLYDAAGNLISKTDAKGTTISYLYDALNRLTTIDFESDADIVYGYDSCTNGKGLLCSMTDASGTTSYEYSKKGQVTKETKVINSVNYVTQYNYDMNGNIKTMTYPSGKVITYNYTNDRVISALNNGANFANNIGYKPFGGMSSISLVSGVTTTTTYDNQYRIAGIQAGTILSLNYNLYDANGNIKSILNTLDSTRNKSFEYDSLDRLSTADGLWGSLGWTYDGVGNRRTENANIYTYPSNSNKLSSANGISFGYDNNGNTTTEGTRQYIYNQNQRLIQVNDGSTTATYTYNGNGQRVKKVVNGAATIFHYSLNGLIIAESDSSGNITVEYVYLNSQPLAKIEGVNTYYYHNDHLGTPQKITDTTGAVKWRADYKPFGEATVTVSTITNNLRFPGQYYDAETGLHYNYYRDYNPIIGRFIEHDPIGLKGGINLYRYVKNNPLKYKDPRGLVWVYDQSTGTMVHVDDQTGAGTFAGDGYSGNGVGLNNPAEQNTPNVGPIPQGTYDIGDQRTSQQTGPAAMDLTPRDGTNTNGRTDFQIHGDNRQGDNSASHGCIVQNRDTRDQIQNSNDRILEVVP